MTAAGANQDEEAENNNDECMDFIVTLLLQEIIDEKEES